MIQPQISLASWLRNTALYPTPNGQETPGIEEHVKRHPSNVQTGKILQDA